MLPFWQTKLKFKIVAVHPKYTSMPARYHGSAEIALICFIFLKVHSNQVMDENIFAGFVNSSKGMTLLHALGKPSYIKKLSRRLQQNSPVCSSGRWMWQLWIRHRPCHCIGQSTFLGPCATEYHTHSVDCRDPKASPGPSLQFSKSWFQCLKKRILLLSIILHCLMEHTKLRNSKAVPGSWGLNLKRLKGKLIPKYFLC